jgi:hypothetical protein
MIYKYKVWHHLKSSWDFFPSLDERCWLNPLECSVVITEAVCWGGNCIPCCLIHSQQETVDQNLAKSLTCSNYSMAEGKDLKAKGKTLDMVPPLWHRILLKTRPKSVFQYLWQMNLPEAVIQLNSEHLSKTREFLLVRITERKKQRKNILINSV